MAKHQAAATADNQSNISTTEITAGITSFLTMVYIVFVNPTILHAAGLDKGAVFTATCIVTAFACILTGLIAKMPIGIAPGMALNVYFTYSVVLSNGVPWPKALAMVVVSGIAFFIISFTKLRRLLLDAIPTNLQVAILIGISLLIALIAFESAQVLSKNDFTAFKFTSLNSPQVLLFFLGFVMLVIMDYFKIYGAIIINILTMTIISTYFGLTNYQGILSLPPSLAPTFMAMDFSDFLTIDSLKIIFTFFVITVFDASGTLLGLFNQPELVKYNSYKNNLGKTLSIDAAASTLAGMLGSSSTSPYIESAAGIQAGGRTGLTAVIIGIGFLLMLFFYPLAKLIPTFAVAPTLLYVACCMLKNVQQLTVDDITESGPCLFTILLIPLTSSITDGVGIGIILYTIAKLAVGKSVNNLTILLALLFISFYIFTYW